MEPSTHRIVSSVGFTARVGTSNVNQKIYKFSNRSNKTPLHMFRQATYHHQEVTSKVLSNCYMYTLHVSTLKDTIMSKSEFDMLVAFNIIHV
jgi:hypothetical protein